MTEIRTRLPSEYKSEVITPDTTRLLLVKVNQTNVLLCVPGRRVEVEV
jgi:hypothetical protein